MKRLVIGVFGAFLAGSLGAETWTWIGGSSNTYSGGKVGPNLGSARDWRDGYNWRNSAGERGTLYPDNTSRPQNGDFIVFDGAVKAEYTHCYNPPSSASADDGSGAYGGILFTNSYSGSYGSYVTMLDGACVRVRASNDCNNQSFGCSGTLEINIAPAGRSMQAHLANKTGTVRKTGPGTWKYYLGEAQNKVDVIRLEEGALTCGVASTYVGEALPSIKQQLVFAGNGVTLNLNGRSMPLVAKLVEEAGISGHRITSTAAACLSLTGAQDNVTFSGTLDGLASLAWKPNDATKVLTLSGSGHTTTGSLIASNGVIAITAADLIASAKLDAEGGSFSFPNVQRVRRASGSVIVNDVVLPDGLYTSTGTLGTRVTWLTGDVTMEVGGWYESGETVQAVWTGTGNMSAVGNWKDATELPPLGTGVLAMSVEGDTSATVDAPYWIRGITIADTVKAFAFAGTDELVLGSLGLVTPGVGGTYALGAPMGILTNQSWTVRAGDTLTLAAPLTTRNPGTLTFDGAGTSLWTVAQSALSNGLYFTSGTAKVMADNALGTGETIVEGAAADLKAAEYAGSFTHKSGTLSMYSRTNYVFRGKFSYLAGGFSRSPSANVTWTFAGGMKLAAPTYNQHTFGGGGRIVVTNGILDAVGTGDRFNLGAGELHLYGEKNRLNETQQGWIEGSDTKLFTHVTNAIYGANFGVSCNTTGGSTWDLCGCDQDVVNLQCGRGRNGADKTWKTSTQPGTICSTAPAILHLRDSAYSVRPSSQNSPSSTNWAYFVGQAGISKEGSYIGHWLLQQCSSSGIVQVTQGKLVFGKRFVDANGNDYGEGSWTNAARVVAKGTGTLVLEHSHAIGRVTDVVIADSGKVQLDAGVVQRCNTLYFQREDGENVRQRYGTWGSSSSSASHTDDTRFTGTGILRVYGTNAGAVVIVK